MKAKSIFWSVCTVFLLLWVPALQAQPLAVGKPLVGDYGLTFDYENGGSINLRIEDNLWKLIFLDKDKLVIEPAWTGAAVRWELRSNTTFRYNAGFIKGDGPFLVSSRNVYPQYNFWVYLSLVNPDGSAKKLFPRGLIIPAKVK